jgi:hypothetical protein
MRNHDSEYEEASNPYLMEFNCKTDKRGDLNVIDFKDFPFEVMRFFTISVRDVSFERGHHAHRECWQALFPSGGECMITIQNRNEKHVFKVTNNQILIVPPYNWCSVRFNSTSTIVNVFASHLYDEGDYILLPPIVKSR